MVGNSLPDPACWGYGLSQIDRQQHFWERTNLPMGDMDEQHGDQALPCQVQPRRWCYDQADLGRRPWQRDKRYQPDLLTRLAQNAA
jgi:hypothetical protein